MLKALLPVAVILLLLAGCHSKPNELVLPDNKKNSASDKYESLNHVLGQNPDQYRLVQEGLQDKTPAWLSNGTWGILVGLDGSSKDESGQPLPAYHSLEFDKTPKEKIRPFQSPLGTSIFADGVPVKPDQNFRRSLDMLSGTLRLDWTQSIKGKRLVVTCFVWLSRNSNHLYERYVFDGDPTIVRTTKILIPSELAPSGSTTTFSGAEKATIGMSKELTIDFKQAASGKDSSQDWNTDIQIDGPEEDQKAVKSFIYYLRSSMPSKGPIQPSPMALSSGLYDGHVFWDADIWLMPALCFVQPEPILSGLAQYRNSHEGKTPGGAPFPWESSVTGKETAPPSFQSEIHVSGSVNWAQDFALSLGAKNPQRSVISKNVAGYYFRRATSGANNKLDLKGVVGADENHTGNNDLYTNLVAQFSFWQSGWVPILGAPWLNLPHDTQSLLNFEGDPIKSYKQADALLGVFPLQNLEAEGEANTLVSRFADKVIPNGPAMSDSVTATILARLGQPDRAYEYWKRSWKDFMTGPLMLFSEKRGKARTYFTTGAAGSLQSVIYGFLGFRVDTNPAPKAIWKQKLLNNKWLSIVPSLPKSWNSAVFKNFYVLGKTYTLTVRRRANVVTAFVRPGG